MRKTVLLLALTIALLGSSNLVSAQLNKKNEQMIIGKCNRNEIETNFEFATEYDFQYAKYQIDSKQLDLLRVLLKNRKIQIHIVFGTWCSDSKMQVPRLMKLLDLVHFSKNNISFEGVDENKTTSKDLNIQKVPTFIFYERNQEIGRIVEKPKQSLESDLISLLKAK